jgi:predicted aspartyl protease
VPVLVFDLSENGPAMALSVSPSLAARAAATKRGEQHLPPVQIAGLIDTGATQTVLREGTCRKLRIHPTNLRLVRTVTAECVPCHEYPVSLRFSDTVSIETTVIELPLKGQTTDCLIGRDLLQKLNFVYLGPANSFSIAL